jgi:hypothetical protein
MPVGRWLRPNWPAGSGLPVGRLPKPTQGSFQELPGSFTRKIEVGPGEQERLSLAIAELMENASLRETMSLAATEHARLHMRIEEAADAYLDLIREVQDEPALPVPADALRSDAGVGQRLIWGLLYRGFRVGHLVRTYGWSAALNRMRGAAA